MSHHIYVHYTGTGTVAGKMYGTYRHEDVNRKQHLMMNAVCGAKRVGIGREHAVRYRYRYWYWTEGKKNKYFKRARYGTGNGTGLLVPVPFCFLQLQLLNVCHCYSSACGSCEKYFGPIILPTLGLWWSWWWWWCSPKLVHIEGARVPRTAPPKNKNKLTIRMSQNQNRKGNTKIHRIFTVPILGRRKSLKKSLQKPPCIWSVA